jgi:hypothetical protein
MNQSNQRRRQCLSVFAVLLTLTLCVGCNSKVLLTLPREMEGVWTTDDPRFQGRFMELSPSFVIIVTGHDDPASVQFVDKVETSSPGDFSSLTIYSTDYSEGAHYQMKLQFSPANGGELRFQNQGLLWKRGQDMAN